MTLLNLLYPVGSLYIASGNLSTCPLSVLGVGTWTLKTTTTLVTGVNGTAPVVGNGISLGLTDGTNYAGINQLIGSSNTYLQAMSSDYGVAVGQTGGTGTKLGSNIVAGVTTDPTKSGIQANITSTTLAVTIWERVA